MSENLTRPLFEDCISQIDHEIYKRKARWNLTAISWMDFEDVAQIIRIHIYKKWEQYDPSKPLSHWVNTIISNQTRNLIRNVYTNFTRPCLRCALAEGLDGCREFGKQCNDCPLFRKWEKTRKRAHDSKLPLPLEHHTQEVYNKKEGSIDIEKSSANLHVQMKKVLKPSEWKVYNYLYIEGKTDEEVAALMEYTTTEKNKSPGYKRLKIVKKIILDKARAVAYGPELEII